MHTDHEGLHVRGVSKRWGATQALDHVDLDVRSGEVVALLGENGAGKSTLSSIVAGSLPPDTGTMHWRGHPYAPKSPREALDAGIGLIHQETRLLPDLTIAENIFVGRQPMRGGRVDRGRMEEVAAEHLSRLGLRSHPRRLVGELSIAAQQQVEIAKALTLDAELLILDEPTAALGGEETENLFACVERLREDGVSFVYISHRMAEISRIADRVVVLRDGARVATHTTGQVEVNRLIEDMVGRSIDRVFPDLDDPGDTEVLTVRGLSTADGAVRDVGFEVREGEVFGIAGIVGAGRTELVRAVAGADPITDGEISLDGRSLRVREPRDAVEAGIVLVPEDRRDEGAVLHLSIADNIALPSMAELGPGGWVVPRAVRDRARSTIADMGVKGTPEQPVAALSGGNQQKVVIGKWLARRPRVVILDEPTRGIDIGSRSGIYEVIAELAREGTAVIVVSSDLEEVLGLAHRVLVLSRGERRGVLDRREATDVAVMELATA